jgi:hypothetical protein
MTTTTASEAAKAVVRGNRQSAEHRRGANLFSLMQQLGALPANQNRSREHETRFRRPRFVQTDPERNIS